VLSNVVPDAAPGRKLPDRRRSQFDSLDAVEPFVGIESAAWPLRLIGEAPSTISKR